MSATVRLLRFLLLFVLGVGLVGCSSSKTVPAEKEGETVNTGYGKQDKKNSASSTSTVNPGEQDKDAATDFSDLLQGRTAGVQVQRTSSGIRVTIRGRNSVHGDDTPLYVVDGMTVEPNFDGSVPVHPRSVKSITVLKDGGATSIYGSRGANGVIVIETKEK